MGVVDIPCTATLTSPRSTRTPQRCQALLVQNISRWRWRWQIALVSHADPSRRTTVRLGRTERVGRVARGRRRHSSAPEQHVQHCQSVLLRRTRLQHQSGRDPERDRAAAAAAKRQRHPSPQDLVVVVVAQDRCRHHCCERQCRREEDQEEVQPRRVLRRRVQASPKRRVKNNTEEEANNFSTLSSPNSPCSGHKYFSIYIRMSFKV